MRLLSNKKVAFVALCFTLLGASSAYAQQAITSQSATEFDDQLALDVTPVPPGSGAIFVPTLSNPKTESHVIVYYKGDKIASGKTGQRIVVPPGQYDVVMATGEREEAASSEARVVEGSTIVLTPFYGGVKLIAVDMEGRPKEVRYGIKQGNDMVVRTSTPKTDVAKVRSYLLRPGPKTWVFDDGTEVAFNVPQGEMTAYRAVFDGDKFIGLELGSDAVEKRASEKWWRARLTVGADVSASYSKQQLSDYNGIYGQLGAFANLELGVDTAWNLLTFKLGIDESWIMIDSEYGANVPIRSMRDQLSAELFYAFRAWRVLGPFVRAKATTSMFGNKYYPAENTTITVDGAPSGTTTYNGGPNVRLLRPFNPLFLEEAAGINVTVLDNSVFDLTFLGGIAARQNFFDLGSKKDANGDKTGTFYVKGVEKDGATTKVDLGMLTNEKLYGALVEARLGLRIAQNFRVSASGHMFVPYQQIPGVYKASKKWTRLGRRSFEPLYGFNGMAELNINRWLSVVVRGEYTLPTLQIENPAIFGGAALRFTANLF